MAVVLKRTHNLDNMLVACTAPAATTTVAVAWDITSIMTASIHSVRDAPLLPLAQPRPHCCCVKGRKVSPCPPQHVPLLLLFLLRMITQRAMLSIKRQPSCPKAPCCAAHHAAAGSWDQLHNQPATWCMICSSCRMISTSESCKWLLLIDLHAYLC
jgi:hypothetical protein